MNKKIKNVYFDTLTNFVHALNNLNKKKFDLQKDKRFFIEYFKNIYVKDLEPKQPELLNQLIENEIDNNVIFLKSIKALEQHSNEFSIIENELSKFNEFNSTLNYLVNYYTEDLENQNLNDVLNNWLKTENVKELKKQLKIHPELLDKINLISFYHSKKGIVNDNASYLSIINVFNNNFVNQLNSLEFINKTEVAFKHLKENEIINNITNEEKIAKVIKANKKGYIGFDPSAISLHLGNYVMINIINKLRLNGFNIIPVVGGATGSIGDPSGKKSERVLQDNKTILRNKLEIIKQLKRYAHSNIVLDNYDNFKNMNYLDFLRDVGKLINVNYMLEKDIVKSRLDTGISYTEFSYTLMQGYDFIQFYKNYDIALQGGGSDQWGNITTGIEMIRKSIGDDNLASGFTINLLTKSDGTKFGKSEKGAVYLNKNLTSVYEMFQFLINQSDIDSIKLLKFLTTYEQYKINIIEKLYNSPEMIKLRIPQNALAYFLINEIHSNNEYNDMIKISKCLFNNDLKSLTRNEILMAFNNLPFVEINEKEMNFVDLLVLANVCSSKREAREMITNNSISINGEKYNDVEMVINNKFTMHDLFTVIRKGKKNYFIIKWN